MDLESVADELYSLPRQEFPAARNAAAQRAREQGRRELSVLPPSLPPEHACGHRGDVERVSDSCGHGVPIMNLVGKRDLLRLTAEKKGRDGMDAYRAQQNAESIDGLLGL